MSKALIPVTVVTLIMVALQLSILSPLRLWGVVVMLVWLWPFSLGLGGYTMLSLWSAIVAGIFFDTHAVTPFGLTAVVGVILAYGASRLGKEGVGDLDSAAWWVTPALGAGAGFFAPLLYVFGGFVTLHFSMWRAGTLASMGVNAIAFLILARPVARIARYVGNIGARARR